MQIQEFPLNAKEHVIKFIKEKIERGENIIKSNVSQVETMNRETEDTISMVNEFRDLLNKLENE